MMKIRKTNTSSGTRDLACPSGYQVIRWLSIALMISLLTIFQHQPALAIPLSDSSSPIPIAAMKLVQFCADPKVGLDAQAVATLVDYVLGPKSNKEADLPKLQEAPGAYYEFDTRINFSSFLQYSYSNQIPSVLTSPSSLRYSLWTGLQGEAQKMPSSWKLVRQQVSLSSFADYNAKLSLQTSPPAPTMNTI
jgi:hypothetical protein